MGRSIAWRRAALLAGALVAALAGPASRAEGATARPAAGTAEPGDDQRDEELEAQARSALAEQARELERLAHELAQSAPGNEGQDYGALHRQARELERRAREVARLARRAAPRAGASLEIERAVGAGSRAARQALGDAHVRVLELGGGGYLGIGLADVDDKTATRLGLSAATGVRVRSVEPGSAAERAGLASDDVILKYADQAVWSAAQLRRLVRETPAGREVALELWRDKANRRVAVTMGERAAARAATETGDGEADFHFDLPGLLDGLGDLPAWDERGHGPGERHLRLRLGQPGGPRRLGLSFQELNDQLARHFKAPGNAGVLVSEVVEGGPAALAGVQAGDVIVALGEHKVATGDDLHAALRGRKAGEEVELKVVREGKALALAVKLGGARG